MGSIDMKFKDPQSYPKIDVNDGKNEFLKLWKKNSHSDVDEDLFRQAVRYLYGNENNGDYSIEEILLT